jgi:hypothetical protein
MEAVQMAAAATGEPLRKVPWPAENPPVVASDAVA